jgi:sarcosine oxidase subunit gamma
MAEISPLAGWPGLHADGLRLAEVPFVNQVNLRLSPEGPAADAVGKELGVPLPVEPNTVARADDRTVLWLGPDEWLVLGGCDESRLRAAAGTEPASVVDVSAHRTTVRVSGAHSRDLLAHGCSLDLHPSRFPAGRCAQTMLAHAPVILLPLPADEFWVLVRASFARYLAEWLLDAAVEYR